MIVQYFPFRGRSPGHVLNKIFYRKTIKVSYSTMPNGGRIIAGHNNKVIAGKILVMPKRPWGKSSTLVCVLVL